MLSAGGIIETGGFKRTPSFVVPTRSTFVPDSLDPNEAVFELGTELLGVQNVNDYFTVVGKQLPAVCDADFFNLIIVNLRLGLYLRHFSPGFPEHIFHDYSEEEAKSDLMLQHAITLEAGSVMHLAAISQTAPAPDGWNRLDQCFRKKSGFVDSIAVLLFRDPEPAWGAGLVLYRQAPHPQFEEEDVQLMRRLGPLLAAGFDNAWQSALLATNYDTLTDIFFQYGNMTILVDRRGTPALVHESTEKVLRLLYPTDEPDTVSNDKLPGPLATRIVELIDLLRGNPRLNLVSGDAPSNQGTIRLYVTPKHEVAATDAIFQVVIMCEPGFADLRILSHDGYTERQLDVVELLQRGLNLRDIGRQLRISENTVKFHLKSLSLKLGASGKAEVLSRAIARSFELAVEFGLSPDHGKFG
jgi:DNA-binding CsgD family transcriptional regulator